MRAGQDEGIGFDLSPRRRIEVGYLFGEFDERGSVFAGSGESSKGVLFRSSGRLCGSLDELSLCPRSFSFEEEAVEVSGCERVRVSGVGEREKPT